MLNIQIDQQEVRQLLLEKLEEKLKEVDSEILFWNAKELMRRTGFSWNFILEQFFHDPRFKKHKVGNKWVFPAKESHEFLRTWLSEQPRS